MDDLAQAEWNRLAQSEAREANWQRWGPYLAERQWGTVREDYSADGDVWHHFTHDESRRRAYRWGEDGLLGITDRECRLCLALGLWNGEDAILKERLFGLTGPQGNHGEDVKEIYFYLDALPTSAYLKAIYLYPRRAFPYDDLVATNGSRDKHEREYEVADTDAFADGWFEVVAEYAKASPNDVFARFTVTNRSDTPGTLHVLPTAWFRNTWIWGCRHEGCTLKPRMSLREAGVVQCEHETLEPFVCHFGAGPDGKAPTMLFTDNETNTQNLYGYEHYTPYTKDAFHRYIIHGQTDAVNPKQVGTRAAGHYVLELAPQESRTIQLRLCAEEHMPTEVFGKSFDQVFAERIAETDAFYDRVAVDKLDEEGRRIQRQAFAGLLWSKQFYHYIVDDWLEGDEAVAKPPEQRLRGRNRDWEHLYARDVLSMPDKWEYPWFAAWDTAFHMLPMASIDPHFAKSQLELFLREWYMHPNGQLPAYEFAFDDVNPPVHAWACWRVFKMTAPRGQRDRRFLASTFQKCLLNFTWWVNRKDVEGDNLFTGGFLGLDNIGVFDRSQPLPDGAQLQQADGTAWMAFYCAKMLRMALELAQSDPEYEDMASKFFEHFVAIADAINTLDGGLWNEDDGFYYDHLKRDGETTTIKVRSLVGLIPMITATVIELKFIQNLEGFRKRSRWFMKYRKDLARHITLLHESNDDGAATKALLAIPSRDRLERMLRYLLDENEFLSPFGIRSLSKHHEKHPFEMNVNGNTMRITYEPGESTSSMFGGNSNWRGPIWFPINYLIIEGLQHYHYFYGDDLKVECPTGSGNMMNLDEVANELSRRLARLFVSCDGERPCHGGNDVLRDVSQRHGAVLFHEYFHAETGEGLGASHQTGWTALITKILDDLARA